VKKSAKCTQKGTVADALAWLDCRTIVSSDQHSNVVRRSWAHCQNNWWPTVTIPIIDLCKQRQPPVSTSMVHDKTAGSPPSKML
jgi:hypothetical protein